jgi:hypothetical protein
LRAPDYFRDFDPYIHNQAAPQQLEYPIGKVLFKTNGYISHPRISPNGKLVAFLEHPIFGDDRGYVTLVDAKGAAKRLGQEAPAIEGLAWSGDGEELLYSATEPEDLSQERMVLAVTLQGRHRKILQVPGDTVIWDITADGRMLLEHQIISSAQMFASPATATERDMSVLGYGTYGAISSDG